jgi:hypothetical protein
MIAHRLSGSVSVTTEDRVKDPLVLGKAVFEPSLGARGALQRRDKGTVERFRHPGKRAVLSRDDDGAMKRDVALPVQRLRGGIQERAVGRFGHCRERSRESFQMGWSSSLGGEPCCLHLENAAALDVFGENLTAVSALHQRGKDHRIEHVPPLRPGDRGPDAMLDAQQTALFEPTDALPRYTAAHSILRGEILLTRQAIPSRQLTRHDLAHKRAHDFLMKARHAVIGS